MQARRRRGRSPQTARSITDPLLAADSSPRVWARAAGLTAVVVASTAVFTAAVRGGVLDGVLDGADRAVE